VETTTSPSVLPPASQDGSAPRRWAALAVLCVALLIVNLDNTVLNVALPTLVRDLHATDSELQWIVDAYVMVFAGLLLVMGSLADRIGRKRVFLTGLAAFATGSAWAAFSGSVGMLIAARASMGIGGAMMMPATLSIITDAFRDPAAWPSPWARSWAACCSPTSGGGRFS
jgi:MFS family permease